MQYITNVRCLVAIGAALSAFMPGGVGAGRVESRRCTARRLGNGRAGARSAGGSYRRSLYPANSAQLAAGNSTPSQFSGVDQSRNPSAMERIMLTKLLTQLGLDPGNVQPDGCRVGKHQYRKHARSGRCVLYVITLLMRTIMPPRIFGIFGDMFFIGYGLLANSVTTLFLYILLLPINSVRLYQMVKLVKKARVSAQGDLSMSSSCARSRSNATGEGRC
jgi:hypothetical protein